MTESSSFSPQKNPRNMIYNAELVKTFINFSEANHLFLHCQIVARNKDHPEGVEHKGVLKTYFIRSRAHLSRVLPEIMLLCEHYGARAYINPAVKDFEALQKLMLVKLASDVMLNNIRNPRSVLNSAAGELKPMAPRWIIDIDDVQKKEAVYKWLDEEFKIEDDTDLPYPREAVYFFAEIPTVNGCHLIVKPFNRKKFSESFPDIDVHPNSAGTLLYYPNIKHG